MKVCILGLGYIGLPMTCLLGLNGHKSIGVDIDKNKVKKINNRTFNLKEKDFDILLKKLISEKLISIKTKPEKADFFIICVPTPLKKNLSCNLNYVINAIKSMLPYIEKGNTIIIESTLPPGTMKKTIKPLIEKKVGIVGKEIHLAYCPERGIPGNLINEIIKNDRIIGGFTEKCKQKTYNLYKTFVKGKIFFTDATTAEMVKLSENIFRDVNIALANELSILCNELNTNVLDVISLANKHPRVNIHAPGPGVGGHCLPVDPYFVIQEAKESSKLINISRQINENMPKYIINLIKKIVKTIPHPKIAIWGLSYKANIEDTRNSPSIEIIKELNKENFNLSIYDPFVMNNKKSITKQQSLKNSNLLLILVDHKEFKLINHKLILQNMENPVILDTKNILDVQYFLSKGITVYNFNNFYSIN